MRYIHACSLDNSEYVSLTAGKSCLNCIAKKALWKLRVSCYAGKNSQTKALNIVWVNKWKNAKFGKPILKILIIISNCLKVDKAFFFKFYS